MQFYKARLADFILAVGGDVVHFKNLLYLRTNESSVHSVFTSALNIGQGSPTKNNKVIRHTALGHLNDKKTAKPTKHPNQPNHPNPLNNSRSVSQSVLQTTSIAPTSSLIASTPPFTKVTYQEIVYYNLKIARLLY